jgi:organic radical activating enzyme
MKINEIFQSLQGEGYNVGKDVVFIRTSGCNLECEWCDTAHQDGQEMDIHEIITAVLPYDCHNVIITGGEPTIQKELDELIAALNNLNFWIGMESNGILKPPKAIDYIAISPKSHYKYDSNIIYCDEVRVVAAGKDGFELSNLIEFCNFVETKFLAPRYYISPCSEDVGTAIAVLGTLNEKRSNKWQLSIQAHKSAGIR